MLLTMDFTNVQNFNDLLDIKYGKSESPERKEFEEKALSDYQMDSNLEKCLSLYWNNPELGIFTAKANGLLLDLVNFLVDYQYYIEYSCRKSMFRLNQKGDYICYNLQSNLYETIYLSSILEDCSSYHDEILYSDLSPHLKTKEESLEIFTPYIINHLNEIYPDEST